MIQNGKDTICSICKRIVVKFVKSKKGKKNNYLLKITSSHDIDTDTEICFRCRIKKHNKSKDRKK